MFARHPKYRYEGALGKHRAATRIQVANLLGFLPEAVTILVVRPHSECGWFGDATPRTSCTRKAQERSREHGERFDHSKVRCATTATSAESKASDTPNVSLTLGGELRKMATENGNLPGPVVVTNSCCCRVVMVPIRSKLQQKRRVVVHIPSMSDPLQSRQHTSHFHVKQNAQLSRSCLALRIVKLTAPSDCAKPAILLSRLS